MNTTIDTYPQVVPGNIVNGGREIGESVVGVAEGETMTERDTRVHEALKREGYQRISGESKGRPQANL